METANALHREVEYPAHCTTTNAKKKYKEKILEQNHHELYADYTRVNNKRTINNLIFYTTAVQAWKSALEEHFNHVVKEGIGRGGRMTVCKNSNLDTDDPVLTVNYYT